MSGYDGLVPSFADALRAMIAAAPGAITINSGYRSPERQARLWEQALAKYGSPEAARKWVAPPGRSNHNHGLAADLGYASPEVQAWAHENAANYGLNFRMSHEPWHIELIDGKPVAVPDGAPPAGAPVTGPQAGPNPQLVAALLGSGPDVGGGPAGSAFPGIMGDAGPTATVPFEGQPEAPGLLNGLTTGPSIGALLEEIQLAYARPRKGKLPFNS